MEQRLGETPHDRVRAISEEAKRTTIDNNIPIRRYVRALTEVHRMATIFEAENDYYSAFALYNKFLTIFIEKLPNHREYRSVQVKDFQDLKSRTKEILSKAESVKKVLLKQYEKEYEQQKEQLRKQLEEEERQKRLEEQLKREENEKLLEFERKAQEARNEEERKREEERLRIFKENAERDRIEKEKQKEAEPRKQNSLKDPTPQIDRSLKPSYILNNTGSSIKKMYIPGDLVPNFVSLSSENTRKGIEFCSFIGGKLKNNTFQATHLIIPNQQGTPDSCAATNEDEIWEAMNSHELLQLGWIHTHPTQTAFLSSVDLHTTFPNQQMLAEYIAIVWSGKTKNARYLALTSSGMDTVRQCTKQGFHEHPGADPLFEDCQHIIIANSLSVQKIDLR